ncbi:MAG: tRNA preQ1(34) S-adenosylmethionine ribosyltransferase-isomerase QueA [Gemmatimonadetes bacterium]|nr:MAG: tRNA preQ1(34) S-adenosylmethionine ribosyltransferase-isomerase QueA [Gemmatimonadota bacterium]
MHISDFDYHLPEDRIAQEPLPERDACRLLVCDRARQRFEDRIFRDVGDYLHPGDVLVLNETRVIPARLFGRLATGREIEVFLVHEVEPDQWHVLLKPALKAKIGKTITFDKVPLTATVTDYAGRGQRILKFEYEGDFKTLIESIGNVPLPPYIHRPPVAQDREQYQTVYARQDGAVAAPTAGLHFTPHLLDRLKQKGVIITSLVLHVGIGTFRPVTVTDPREHQMDKEWYSIGTDAAETINTARANGGRIIAVGTTVVRTLESVADAGGVVQAQTGWTDIFIYPPYRFKCVDGLITNFHLPKSTLLMLVSAFAGHEFTVKAYHHAVNQQYRFYSYGDAMLIF